MKGSSRAMKALIVVSFLISIVPRFGYAQEKTDQSSADLSQRVSKLSILVQRLQARVDELEGASRVTSQPAVSNSSTAAPVQPSSQDSTALSPSPGGGT